MYKLTTFFLLTLVSVSINARPQDPVRGPHPYDFPARNAQTSLVLQENRDRNRNSGAKQHGVLGGDMSAGVIINNTTIAAGNWQQIEMTLGDGSEGMIMSESHQDNTGDSQANSQVSNNSESLSNKQSSDEQ
ncbi:hypothetical protein ACSL9D_004016 [Vibrio alginolyticus]